LRLPARLPAGSCRHREPAQLRRKPSTAKTRRARPAARHCGDHPARPAVPPAARLANLVDLRGNGHPTLFLAIPDAQGRTQIVAVRRVP